MQTLVDKLNLISRENLEGMLVIRAFNTQKFEEARFDGANVGVDRHRPFIKPGGNDDHDADHDVYHEHYTGVLIVWFGAHQIANS